MIRFCRFDVKKKDSALNYHKIQKSERRYAAFMYVPGYILVFWLIVFLVGQFETELDDLQSSSRNVGVRTNAEDDVHPAEKARSVFGTVDEPGPDGLIELNSASVTLLDTLPGIGPQKAAKIVETRATMNGYRTVDDLLNVDGIGEKIFEKIKPYVYISE